MRGEAGVSRQVVWQGVRQMKRVTCSFSGTKISVLRVFVLAAAIVFGLLALGAYEAGEQADGLLALGAYGAGGQADGLLALGACEAGGQADGFLTLRAYGAEVPTYMVPASGDTRGETDRKAFNKIAKEHYNEEKVIVFESGKTYYIDATLHLPNDTTIKADGATVRQVSKGYPIFINAYFPKSRDTFYQGIMSKEGPSQSVGGYNRCRNITIDGGTFIDVYEPADDDPAGKFEGYKHGFSNFQFIHGKNITVKNCTIQNNYNGHFIELAGIDGVLISNVKFNGTYVGDSTNEVIQIETTYNESVSPSGAPWDGTPTKNVTIENCTFDVKGSPRGIGTNGDCAKSYSNINIINNTISARDYAIRIVNCDGGKIAGNEIKNGYNSFIGARNMDYQPLERPSDVWKRLFGAGRYDTMKAIVDEGFSATGGTVVIATGSGFKDALAASGLAGIYRAPVVLTDGRNLSSQAEAVLKRLKPAKVYVAGGSFAVKDKVLDDIKRVTGVSPERLFGQTSSGTSASLAIEGKGFWKDSTAIIATNRSFKDALSVAPISYAKGYPILLADNGQSLSLEVIDALKLLEIKKVIIVGGRAAVTENVEKQLKTLNISISERLAGANGVATSAAIAKWGISKGMSVNKMGVATSQNYPDALAGAALCGYNNAILVLADDDAIGNATFPRDYKSSIKRGYVFGGSFAVGIGTWNTLVQSVA